MQKYSDITVYQWWLSKEYLYEDGASFWEYNRVIDATAVASVKGITFPVSVKLIEHEYWSTDNAGSKYWYEKA